MSFAIHAPLVLVLSWSLDLFVGEPPALLHPVVWMGKLITPFKRAADLAPVPALLIGVLALLTIAFGFALGSFWLLRALLAFPLLHFVCQVYLLWSAFALRGLLQAGRAMQRAVVAHDVVAARAALSSLCSRDPSQLDETELLGATVESITENASDSVVAPLFFFALLGVPGALFYRAVNTLDAMVGYRGRFEWLGKPSARLDDLLNFVPARLTALLLWCSGALMLAFSRAERHSAAGLSLSRARHVFLRDRNQTESPNAGQVMAMASGLLGVRLDKRDHYVLGPELSAPDALALSLALRLVELSGWLFFALLLGFLWLGR